MTKRKTDSEFRAEVKALAGDEYLVLQKYADAHKKIAFLHQKCRNVFQMTPSSFLHGTRCPKCAHKRAGAKLRKNTGLFKKQFYQNTNGDYILVSEYKTATAKITILHLDCGYVYQTTPNQFLRGHRCPYCADRNKGAWKKIDNATFERKIRKLGHEKYVPLQKYKNAKAPILMLHKTCGNKYYVSPDNFYRGKRCPVCAKARMSVAETLAFRDAKDKVSKLSDDHYKIIEKGYKNASTKAIFYHEKCGNEFAMIPSAFFRGVRCPFCKSSRGEKCVREYLKAKSIDFKEQFKIKSCRDQNVLPFDFAVFNTNKSLNCLIEYQGRQHFYDPFTWKRKHGPFNIQSIMDTQKHDAMKLQYCKDHGIKLIRINHPQTSSKSNSIEFIERLVNRTLNKELHVV